MFKHLAPAGAPIRSADLARAFRLLASDVDVHSMLRQSICRRFGVRHTVLASTGRAGMTLLLRALRRLAPGQRTEVLLPAYTCYSVAASVVKAGLTPRIADVAPETLDYAPDELERVDFTRTLAVIATNLYGLPSNLPAIARIAKANGAFVIDDAAQAMGARMDGAWAGTRGDAGLFSFDKGKNVAAIDGGAVVTSSDDIAAALALEAAQEGAAAGLDPHDIVKAIVYSLCLRPSLYWIPNSIPQLGLGATKFTTDFPLTPPSRFLAALAATMLDRLDEFTAARTANAARLLDGLRSVPGVRTIAPLPGAEPVYLRLPILVDDQDARDRVVRSLNAAGIGASGSYPASIADIPELQAAWGDRARPSTGGRLVARRIVTLPTHSYVGAADVARMLTVLAGSLDVAAVGRVRPASAR